ncbi:chemotaxis protein MotB [Breoghania corrubedonensis]|uniref:Chemotaxis protein MotB n=1 Tax=Breoghania corrubedonensis TaxID=665038 RepID=A0A2T5V8S3_9HYPH|nr:MotB family protein [Breoghania corrubedonensis]PTW60158.1 chemotaxis protein MotB [Breoghania corrubedonensis]
MTQSAPTELVIVRRRPPLFAEAPKGGVWKIAYADFMTAMMAFFLVMWLINVTDDNVKKGVAQYFNPVNLAATSPNRRGLNDPDKDGVTNEDGKDQPLGDAGTDMDFDTPSAQTSRGAGTGEVKPGGEFAQSFAEETLFADPYAVLEKLANAVPGTVVAQGSAPEKAGFGIKTEKGAKGGDAYRDPFDPLYWQFTPQGEGSAAKPGVRQVALANPGAERSPTTAGAGTAVLTETSESAPTPPAKPAPGDGLRFAAKDVAVAGAPGPGGADTLKGSGPRPGAGAETAVSAGGVKAASGMDAARSAGNAGPASGKNGVDETERRLRSQLAAIASGPMGDVAARVSVERSDDGLLISLTDAKNFGMFAIGSAEPRPQLVKLMEEIGKTLAASKGDVIIRGHTDARPFHSRTYDNWRLSTARAHIAYYMLMRGGFDAGRVERVEGYADRHLKVPKDPYAAANRRIEILLKEGGKA